MTGSAGQQRVPVYYVADHEVVVPPLPVQQRIVAELQAERAIVDANRKLIEILERKIQARLAQIWGDEPVESEAESPIEAEPSQNDVKPGTYAQTALPMDDLP